MVKVRGHRVELAEVQAAVATHDSVADCAVVVAGSGLEMSICAVVVAAPGARPSLLSLKGHCADRLPTYMIIDKLRVVSELPRTPNGKVDRRLLVERLETENAG